MALVNAFPSGTLLSLQIVCYPGLTAVVSGTLLECSTLGKLNQLAFNTARQSEFMKLGGGEDSLKSWGERGVKIKFKAEP